MKTTETSDDSRGVTYNPYKYSSFITRGDDKAITNAEECYLYVTSEKKARIFAM